MFKLDLVRLLLVSSIMYFILKWFDIPYMQDAPWWGGYILMFLAFINWIVLILFKKNGFYGRYKN